MVEEKDKKVDNLSYKERFQFLLSVNDNIICQRYFKINGFCRESLSSYDLKETLDESVELIKNDLKSKSSIYTEYTTPSTTIKLTGFKPDSEEQTFLKCQPVSYEERVADPLLEPYEVTFKFEFLSDDKVVYTQIWDGTVYPKNVRNSVDITNSDISYRDKDVDKLNFNLALNRRMTIGNDDLVYKIIQSICNVCNMSYYKNYGYEHSFKYCGTEYSTIPNRDYIDGWYQATKNKTREYFRK